MTFLFDPTLLATDAQNPLIIVISGPTASGKTNLAIALAKHFGAEIISFDSRQFYHELNIGTAKPTFSQLSEIPHYFIGHKSIFDSYNADLFAEEARDLIARLSQKLKVIILVGGSGLYLDSLLYSFDTIPTIDPHIRQDLNALKEEKGIQALHELLLEKDPAFYEIVDRKNPQRLIRALEVSLGTGKPYSSFRQSQGQKLTYKLKGRIIKFCVSRPIGLLYQQIEARVDEMITQGLEKEAQFFFPNKHLNPLKTVGYSELFDYFDGKLNYNTAIEKIKQHTRNYAKRQITWFKKDPDNHWIEATDCKSMVAQIIHMIHSI